MRHDRGVQPDERSEWQKRYDASLDRARAESEPIGATTVLETAAGCMPAGPAAVVLGLAGLVVILGRKLRASGTRRS